jgi:hypothetical protein
MGRMPALGTSRIILIDVGVTLVERRLLVWRPVVAGRD